MKSEQIAGNEPAFPSPSDTHGIGHKGLTKRQFIVTQIMSGVMTNEKLTVDFSYPEINNSIKQCFAIADAILNYDK